MTNTRPKLKLSINNTAAIAKIQASKAPKVVQTPKPVTKNNTCPKNKKGKTVKQPVPELKNKKIGITRQEYKDMLYKLRGMYWDTFPLDEVKLLKPSIHQDINKALNLQSRKEKKKVYYFLLLYCLSPEYKKLKKKDKNHTACRVGLIPSKKQKA